MYDRYKAEVRQQCVMNL